MTLLSNNNNPKTVHLFLDKNAPEIFIKSDERCQHRALFMASRLKSDIKVINIRSVHQFWRSVTHRLYTLNYLLFVLPPNDESLLQQQQQQQQQQQLDHRPGALEAHFAVGYALEKQRPLVEFDDSNNNGYFKSVIEQARVVIEQCLENESKLKRQAERDAMYLFHGMRLGSFKLHIEFDDDDVRHRLKRKVVQNKRANPFEDENFIVND